MAIVGPFLGHIVELEGKKGLLFTGQSWRTWSVGTVYCYDWVLGPFLAQKGCFGAQNAQFWKGTSRLGAPAPGGHR